MIHRLALIKRQVKDAAIHLATEGLNQVLHTVMTARLEDVAKAKKDTQDANRRVFKRLTHTRLGRQINHHSGPFGNKKRQKCLALFQRDLLKTPGGRKGYGLDRLVASQAEAAS